MSLSEADKTEIAAFVKERDEMLMALDIDRMFAFHAKYNPGRQFSNRQVAEISLHKARTAAKSLPMFARALSKRWLEERGYTSMDDGDIETKAITS